MFRSSFRAACGCFDPQPKGGCCSYIASPLAAQFSRVNCEHMGRCQWLVRAGKVACVEQVTSPVARIIIAQPGCDDRMAQGLCPTLGSLDSQ